MENFNKIFGNSFFPKEEDLDPIEEANKEIQILVREEDKTIKIPVRHEPDYPAGFQGEL